MEKAIKLTDNPDTARILGADLIKKYAIVTMDEIIIDIKSTDDIHRTINYTETSKFEGWEDESLHECDNQPFVIPLVHDQYGSEFTFRVLSRDKKHDLVVENFQFTVRAELTPMETIAFLKNILNRIDTSRMEPAFFYRNFSKEDEERITKENGGCFEMTLKQKSGHPSSPLFRKLDNIVFFSAKLLKVRDGEKQLSYLPNGFKMPLNSPFGDMRVAYEASKLLNEKSVLFLGGMHCYGRNQQRFNWAHYVTVVVCQRESLSYHTCVEMGLIELNWEANPVLRWDKSTDKLYCASILKREENQIGIGRYPHDVWVEIILCDKAISLDDGHRSICPHIEYPTNHRSWTECESCHGYHKKKNQEDNTDDSTSERTTMKRRSMDEERREAKMNKHEIRLKSASESS